MRLNLINCEKYLEDKAITFDDGESKGQCTCGFKWFEHKLEVLPDEKKESAAKIQKAYEEIK